MLNETVRTKSEQLSLDCLHGTDIQSQSIASLVPLPGSQQLKLVDQFCFSKFAPGMLVLNNLKMNKEPSICLLFKLHTDDILQEMKSNGRVRDQEMVLMSLMQKCDEKGNDLRPCGKFFDIKVAVKYNERTASFSFTLFFQCQNYQSAQLPYRPLDNAWHFLFVRSKIAKNNLNLQMHLDSFDKPENFVETSGKLYDSESENLLALGNNAVMLSRIQSFQKDTEPAGNGETKESL